MGKRSRAFGLALLVCATLAFWGFLAHSPPPAAAAGRCNSTTIDEAYGRIRDYDRHGPGNSQSQLLARFAAVADVLSMMQEEREILDSICSTDAERAPLFAQLAATAAWALTLEADIAARLNASCPAAAKALPTIMLADAWLDMANVVNEQGGTVPQIFKDVIPKVQTRAEAVDLTLPSWADTSAYWRDGVRDKAKALAATCPTPSPSASPTPH